MNIQNNQFLSIEQLKDQYLSSPVKNTGKPIQNGLSFRDILNQQTTAGTELKFSKHASSRLADRNIELTKEQMDRLTEGTNKAGSKGIKDSLVMVDHLAFIVNIPKNTVITAMDQSQADENIFTNIDGAVIA